MVSGKDDKDDKDVDYDCKEERKKGSSKEAGCGMICHNCRQRKNQAHVHCAFCTIRFCGPCLVNRHGEDIRKEAEGHVRWVCPKCRGGCGPGCNKNCCNCGPCRKAQNMEATGPLVKTARLQGFSNVHDYLIHLRTGEEPEEIAKRKRGRWWTSMDQPAKKPPSSLQSQTSVPKKFRTSRYQLVNTKWDSRKNLAKTSHDQLFLTRMVLCKVLGKSVELGHKIKSKRRFFEAIEDNMVKV